MPCAPFDARVPAPFEVVIGSTALFTMDLHRCVLIWLSTFVVIACIADATINSIKLCDACETPLLSHLAKTESMGLLGGRWDATTKCISIEVVRSPHCDEMCLQCLIFGLACATVTSATIVSDVQNTCVQ